MIPLKCLMHLLNRKERGGERPDRERENREKMERE
jgi:hypothetical protein